jgi:co-chaperonin GroES (HSP10)
MYYNATTFTPLRDSVFVTDMEGGESITKAGIIIKDDTFFTENNIKDRWARVYSIGPDITDLNVGEWVLVQRGRWTNRVRLSLPDGDISIWRVEFPDGILLVADEDPRRRGVNVNR